MSRKAKVPVKLETLIDEKELSKEVIKIVPGASIAPEEVEGLPTYWPMGINWETMDMEVLRGTIIKAVVTYAATIQREPTQEEYYRLVYRSIIKALA